MTIPLLRTPQASRKTRVMVVDDNPLNRKILVKLLEPQDWIEVCDAEDGEACLAMLDPFGPDIVLLDLMMPGMDGYEVCRRIKAHPVHGSVSVIMVSGKASTAERLQGYEAAADDYMVKPCNHDELLSKLRVHRRLKDTHRALLDANRRIQKQNANLESIVAARTAEIIATHDLLSLSLAKLAESRDSETGAHLYRMRNYARLLAQELQQSGPYRDQIDDQFVENIYRTSPLHDIGKVGVPDAVLQKPGRLTPEEEAIMQQHVVIGAETLETAARYQGGCDFLEMAAVIARYHHERFDGRGYVQGLAGQEIPLAARIVSLADVYDALTSKRVYKPAYQPETAEDIICEESGHRFDPVVVEAFQRLTEKFAEIAQQPCPLANWDAPTLRKVRASKGVHLPIDAIEAKTRAET